MNWKCCQPKQSRTLRERYSQKKQSTLKKPNSMNQKESNHCSNMEQSQQQQVLQYSQQQIQQQKVCKKPAPLSLKIIDALGLKEYVLDKFVFRKLDPKYQFRECLHNQYQSSRFSNSRNRSAMGTGQKKNKYTMINLKQPQKIPIKNLQGYTVQPQLLQSPTYSIPILYIRHNPQGPKSHSHSHSQAPPKISFTNLTIIYSHGNSSDLMDAYSFFSKLLEMVCINVVIYDYTGYGVSKIGRTTEESLCRDLEAVVDWLGVGVERVLLWGFSLGTFPTVSVAAKHMFAGVILQSPIASAACFIQNPPTPATLPQPYNPDNFTYDMDSLDNLKNIGQIQCPILILHSISDQIIPISHARRLYSIIQSSRRSHKFTLVEVTKLRHNQMHYYLCNGTDNQLNLVFKSFVTYVGQKAGKGNNSNVSKVIRFINSSNYTSQLKMIPQSNKNNSPSLTNSQSPNLHQSNQQDENQRQKESQNKSINPQSKSSLQKPYTLSQQDEHFEIQLQLEKELENQRGKEQEIIQLENEEERIVEICRNQRQFKCDISSIANNNVSLENAASQDRITNYFNSFQNIEYAVNPKLTNPASKKPAQRYSHYSQNKIHISEGQQDWTIESEEEYKQSSKLHAHTSKIGSISLNQDNRNGSTRENQRNVFGEDRVVSNVGVKNHRVYFNLNQRNGNKGQKGITNNSNSMKSSAMGSKNKN